MLTYLCFFCFIPLLSSLQPSSDLLALSELPLEKLLHVKHNLDLDVDHSEAKTIDFGLNSAGTLPEALALHGKKKPHRRGHYDHYDDYPKKNKKSVSTIFQISVTALAFLAFGGYLLCLIVQAVKGKQMMMTQMMTAPVMMTTSTKIRRPGRKKRSLEQSQMENMYRSLKLLAEGYANYHHRTTKNRYFNSSDKDVAVKEIRDFIGILKELHKLAQK